MTLETIHHDACRSVQLRSDDDGLALMILLHTHCICLRTPLVEAPGTASLSALTQRHAAEVVASLWQRPDERAKYEYWYWQFNTRTPFEVVEDVTAEWQPRVNQMRNALLTSPLVQAISPED